MSPRRAKVTAPAETNANPPKSRAKAGAGGAAPHQTLIDAIVSALSAHADPSRAAGQQAYMKRALPFLGVRVPVVRQLTHAACKLDPCTDQAQFLATAEQLFLAGTHQEHRYAGVSVCTFRGHRTFQTPAVFPTYRELIVTAAWWDITDELSHQFGAMLLSHPDETRQLLRAWCHDDDIWLRRTSIIAQLGLKQRVDQALLFECIEPSLSSKEFFLRKAIGWALRELGKTAPDVTRRYVADNASRLSPLSQREALKNLG